jgi:transcriptional regulator with XRE-family HTH domain
MKAAELKDIRESKGLSQRDLAEDAGISHVSVVKIENGKTVYKATFIALCKSLGINPDDVEGVNIYDGKKAWKERVRKKHTS